MCRLCNNALPSDLLLDSWDLFEVPRRLTDAFLLTAGFLFSTTTFVFDFNNEGSKFLFLGDCEFAGGFFKMWFFRTVPGEEVEVEVEVELTGGGVFVDDDVLDENEGRLFVAFVLPDFLGGLSSLAETEMGVDFTFFPGEAATVLVWLLTDEEIEEGGEESAGVEVGGVGVGIGVGVGVTGESFEGGRGVFDETPVDSLGSLLRFLWYPSKIALRQAALWPVGVEEEVQRLWG